MTGYENWPRVNIQSETKASALEIANAVLAMRRALQRAGIDEPFTILMTDPRAATQLQHTLSAMAEFGGGSLRFEDILYTTRITHIGEIAGIKIVCGDRFER